MDGYKGKHRHSKQCSHENRRISSGVHSGGSQSANRSKYNTPDKKSTFSDTKQQANNLETKENIKKSVNVVSSMQ